MPPSIVLEVMKILEKQIALREETRSAEQARPALDQEVYQQRAGALAQRQGILTERVGRVVEKIRGLPDSAEVFGGEIVLLGRVGAVMGEAESLLARPETGPPTIAAETEAIELLLRARRVNPKGGGGSGSSPGGGGQGDTDQSALALVGSGTEQAARPAPRAPRYATGVTGQALPEEFRRGLDAYFEALERKHDH